MSNTKSNVVEIRRKIKVSLVETSVLTRWPCNVCGGCTEKVSILAEGTRRWPDDTSQTVRVCERCIEDDDIDARLELTARQFQAEAENTRALIGRLEVPTVVEYYARDVEHEVSYMLDNGSDNSWITGQFINALADPHFTHKHSRHAHFDWLLSNGMTQPEIDAAIQKAREERKRQTKERERAKLIAGEDDETFPF